MTDQIKIIKSNRKTLSIQISRTGEVIVRAPYGLPEREVMRFLREKEGWIRKRQREALARKKAMRDVDILSPQEINALADQALQIIPGRVAFYAEQIGLPTDGSQSGTRKPVGGAVAAKEI